MNDIHPADALKYAAALLTQCTDWAIDSIGGSMCGHVYDDTASECTAACSHHDDELDAIVETVHDVQKLAALYGDPRRYSDGRQVKTSQWIDQGSLMTSHIWEPDSSAEKPKSWRGHLPSGDPDVASPGLYEVETDPATQTLYIRVVRTA